MSFIEQIILSYYPIVLLGVIGLIAGAATFAFLCCKDRIEAFLQKHRKIRYVLYALGVAFGVVAILGFFPILGHYLYHFNADSAVTAATDNQAAKGWLANADYLSAAATIIGAFIALIPIFWLIKQNAYMREQMKNDKEGLKKQLALQQSQNNADMFFRACSTLTEDSSDAQIIGSSVVLRSLLTLEDGKYTEQICDVCYEVVRKYTSKYDIEHIEEMIRILFNAADYCIEKVSKHASARSKTDLSYVFSLLRGIIEVSSSVMYLGRSDKPKRLEADKLKPFTLERYISYLERYFYTLSEANDIYNYILCGFKKCSVLYIQDPDLLDRLTGILSQFRNQLERWKTQPNLTLDQKEKIVDLINSIPYGETV